MYKITKKIRKMALISSLVLGLGAYAQIGIGTTTPAGGSILDINSTNKGVLVPRINIPNLGNIAPVTGGSTVGLLVWNTNATTGVGYHYWSGSAWVPLFSAASNSSWSLTGNSNATLATNFLGTTNAYDLRFRTNNLNRFTITTGTAATGGRLQAQANGTAASPIYSWFTDTNMGMFRAGTDILAFSTNGGDRMRVYDNGNVTVGFGATAPFAGDRFSAYGPYAVNGYASTTNGWGVYGQATNGFGVFGDATTGRGVVGLTDSNAGVQGEALTTGTGVVGFANSGDGVYGDALTGNGVTGLTLSGIGVYGDATTGIGVLGVASDATTGVAGRFEHTAANGHGLLVAGGNQAATTFAGTGLGISGTGRLIGILGRSTVAGDSNGILAIGNGGLTAYTVPGGSGVSATATNTGIYAYGTDINSTGIYGDGGDMGVYGLGFGGVVGETYDPINGWGVFSFGDFGATGGKYFVIDHPLDPANKYLKHANIESNEILNLYRGTEIFDGSGRAVVNLPNYYDAININPSYQLTPVGAAMPNLYIEQEVTNGRFIVAGGVPGKKVSWQLTAERNDPYMQKYPQKRIMETDKGNDRGKYLMPELYGKSRESSLSINKSVTTDPALRKKYSEAIPQQLTEDNIQMPEIKRKERGDFKKEDVKEDVKEESNLNELEE